MAQKGAGAHCLDASNTAIRQYAETSSEPWLGVYIRAGPRQRKCCLAAALLAKTQSASWPAHQSAAGQGPRATPAMMDEFAWGEGKAPGDRAKHGATCEAARQASDDVFGIERVDYRGESAEAGHLITAMANGVLLNVAYTERSGRIGVMPARIATKHEREEYYLSQAAD